MAKIHEFQGKEILQKFGIPIPIGQVVKDVKDCQSLKEELTGEVVVKAQAWVTGRAGLGLIRFASSPSAVQEIAGELIGKQINQFSIEQVLVEQKLEIESEFYAGVIIDASAQMPVMIFSSRGGSGVEEISKQFPESVSKIWIDPTMGLKEYQVRDLIRHTGITGKLQSDLAGLLVKLYLAAKTYHARALEINPIVLTTDGKLLAADCRFTIDDNAVYRFPELNIELAREFDRPPTYLEKVAWEVEKSDYRGTFFFIQMEQGFAKGDGVIGFHGAGGGGSMMSMDALIQKGFRLANFVDTSGNPPASKVYRAARIILAQKGIDGYFASGSGVASQEQYHSARGLVKAFLEQRLSVPAVIRLGGNAEEQAIRIIENARSFLPVKLEAYGKDDSPDFCAERLCVLVNDQERGAEKVCIDSTFGSSEKNASHSFHTVTGGTVSFDYDLCRKCSSKVCIEACAGKVLSLSEDVPVLNISPEDAERGKCTECLACEVECFFSGNGGGFIHLPIKGLEVI